jgi:gentisate 1,2-dioxygenase
MNSVAPGPVDAAGAEALRAFSSRISPLNLSPLWERKARLVPGSECVPAIWRYSQMRPLLAESAQLISKAQAERRVLVMENPALRGSSFITHALYAGLQIINPGELAPSHRHTPAALRFVVEGEGAYTAVSGERLPMKPGDFVVTPPWAWHDHGNLGTGPVVWMDGLDTPFAQLFGAHFRENYPEVTHPVTRASGNTGNRFGANMLPLQGMSLEQESGRANPQANGQAIGQAPAQVEEQLLIYPFERSRAALHALARSGAAAHPAQGHKLRYNNPVTGGHPFKTMAAFMQLLPASFSGTPYRATDGTVFNVAEGQCRVKTGGQVHELQTHDVLVIPPWETYCFEADTDCVLFSFSDRAAQELLGYWREDSPGV